MDEQQPAPPASPVSPHARLKELQAIPDKLRTDEQWDELNDLEIKLASVNRQGAPMPNAQRQGGIAGAGAIGEIHRVEAPQPEQQGVDAGGLSALPPLIEPILQSAAHGFDRRKAGHRVTVHYVERAHRLLLPRKPLPKRSNCHSAARKGIWGVSRP